MNTLKRLTLLAAIGMMAVLMAGVLASCGGSSASTSASSAAAQKEYDFYSVCIPVGFEESSSKNVFKQIDGNGSFYVSVHNTSADELQKTELQDKDFNRADDVTAGDTTYKVAKSDKWAMTYYITDWEDGSIEVTVKNTDDEDAIKAFLASLKPAANAYHKWQAAS